jgi:hypothetical protein
MSIELIYEEHQNEFQSRFKYTRPDIWPELKPIKCNNKMCLNLVLSNV